MLHDSLAGSTNNWIEWQRNEGKVQGHPIQS